MANVSFTNFKTRIVQRFEKGFEFFELFLPDGRRVASGSLDHVWNERDHWEKCLSDGIQLELF